MHPVWQGPRIRSETSIISTFPPAHFIPQNSLHFNNITPTTHCLLANSGEFQGDKVFILNNNTHFSPHLSTLSFFVNVLEGSAFSVLLCDMQSIVNLALFHFSQLNNNSCHL